MLGRGMNAGPARGIVLCLTKHLAGYGRDIPVTTKNIANYVTHLRQKIESDPAKPILIMTEPGIGYRFISPD
jgi:DNA-binding response OmpR family regulator